MAVKLGLFKGKKVLLLHEDGDPSPKLRLGGSLPKRNLRNQNAIEGFYQEGARAAWRDCSQIPGMSLSSIGHDAAHLADHGVEKAHSFVDTSLFGDGNLAKDGRFQNFRGMIVVFRGVDDGARSAIKCLLA